MRDANLPSMMLMILLTVPGLPVAAPVERDVPGSRDPLDIPRFPHSWIVGYERDDAYLPREFALGRVDRTRRDVRVKQEVRTPATREWATYEMPRGTDPEEVIRHYLNIFSQTPLFTCRGMDCGRSNLWANEIFGRAMLYGPDRNQYYFAGRHGEHLVALYVIERGNKRVYAHLEMLKPEGSVALNPNERLFERLAGEGSGVIAGVVPTRTGALPEEAQQVLKDLAAGLRVFRGQTVFVVCHLYGGESGQVLIERSQRCAQAAVAYLRTEDGPTLVPFGAGPLLPRVGSSARIELVLPHRLSH